MRGSNAARSLGLQLAQTRFRRRSRRAPTVFLDQLAVLLDRAVRVALRLESLTGPEQRLRGLLGEVVEHGDLEELRQGGVVRLGREVQASEFQVGARRERALVERERALERALGVPGPVQVRQGAAAREFCFRRVLEVGFLRHERAQGFERALPVLAFAARETEAEQRLRHHFVLRRLLEQAFQARAGRVEFLAAVLRLAEQEQSLGGERALPVLRDQRREASLPAPRGAALQAPQP